MTEQHSGSSRKRKSKWDVPADANKQIQDNGTLVANVGSSDAAQKARERAAQLAAKLAAEGKLATGTAPPPIVAPPPSLRPSLTQQTGPSLSNNTQNLPNPDIIKIDTGGYMADFEINDLPARVNLTKKAVQDKICQQSGAAIATKGRFMSTEEKQQNKPSDKPLYLSVQAAIQAKVQVALHMIKDVIRNFGKPENNGSVFNGNQNSSLSYIQDKVFVGLEYAPMDYNVRGKLEGPNGSFFHHIIGQTGAKVHLRGKGSGFVEPSSGRESFEPLHIYISHPTHDGLQAAKSLCESLLQSVHDDFKNWDRTRKHSGSQAYSQPSSSSYGQPPVAYPGYNVPPPNYNPGHTNMNIPNVPMSRSDYRQPPPAGQYPQGSYPPPQYPHQPPPLSYPFQYQTNLSASYPPYSQEARHGYPPVGPRPGISLQQPSPSSASSESHRDKSLSDSSSSQHNSLSPHTTTRASQQDVNSSTRESEDPPVQRKRRRFTEDPELLRQSTKPEEVKESTSHSLASNIKFRSTGEDDFEIPRDKSLRETSNARSGRSHRDDDFSHPSTDKRKSKGDAFKAPVVPLSAVLKKPRKPVSKKTEKNILSSLIPYEDNSDSEED